MNNNNINNNMNNNNILAYSLHDYKSKRNALVDHFYYCYTRGNLTWPRGFNKEGRSKYAPAPLLRSIDLLYELLYDGPSKIIHKVNNCQFEEIGQGLYSQVDYSIDDRICKFNGDIITLTDYAKETADGFGGYAIHLNKDYVLNCYHQHKQHKCKGSFANCAKACVLKHDHSVKAINNCRISIHKNIVTLIATMKIKCHNELLWNYGDSYKYPTYK